MVAPPSRKPFPARPEMVWVQRERFLGWACSECAWEFNPSRIPFGNTLAEIKQRYERQRDKEFASHLCAEHARFSESASRDRKSCIGLVLAGPGPKRKLRKRPARPPSAAVTLPGD